MTDQKQKKDEALDISNPRMLSAIYFSLLAIIATILLDTVFYTLGVEQLLPIFKSIILAVVIAAGFGALFGKRIIYSQKPYKNKAFWWAFLMVISALPVYTLGFMLFLHHHHPDLFHGAAMLSIISMYFIVLLYGFLLAGFWFALIAGVAAIYLRGHLVYHLLNSLYVRRRTPTDGVIKHKGPRHGEAHIEMPEDKS